MLPRRDWRLPGTVAPDSTQRRVGRTTDLLLAVWICRLILVEQTVLVRYFVKLDSNDVEGEPWVSIDQPWTQGFRIPAVVIARAFPAGIG